MAKDNITPNLEKKLCETDAIIIYRDTNGVYWRVMKEHMNTRYPITVTAAVAESAQGQSIEDLI